MTEGPAAQERTEEQFLPVSMIAECAYCPRAAYYRFVEKVDAQNAAFLRGKAEAERRSARETLSREEGWHIREVEIASPKLGWSAKVDALVLREGKEQRVVPIEYKTGHARNQLHHKIQVCAQAILLEEERGLKVEEGYLYYMASRQRVTVPITEELRRATFGMADQAWRILRGGWVPEPVADERCDGCALIEICQPFEAALKHGSPADSLKAPPVEEGDLVFIAKDAQRVQLGYRKGLLEVKAGDWRDGRTEVQSLRTAKVRKIVFVGKGSITEKALRVILEHGIEVFWLSATGKYLGRVSTPSRKTARYRRAQYAVAMDPARSLELARRFVEGKIRNCRTVLQRQARNLPGEPPESVLKAQEEMARVLQDVERASSRSMLMGLEGRAARVYWKAFGELLRGDFEGLRFERRTRRPAMDAVNAMLNLGYALLYAWVESALEVAGLDPEVGFLHSEQSGRDALALDLMEEFRPVMVDATVLAMVNRRVVRQKDFQKDLFGGVSMTAEGRKRFFRYLGSRWRELVQHPEFGFRMELMRFVAMQALSLAKVLVGEKEDYKPLVIR